MVFLEIKTFMKEMYIEKIIHDFLAVSHNERC